MTDKVIVCPKCKGKGEVIKIDWLGAVCTFGLTFLEDISSPQRCPICGGKGVIKL